MSGSRLVIAPIVMVVDSGGFGGYSMVSRRVQGNVTGIIRGRGFGFRNHCWFGSGTDPEIQLSGGILLIVIAQFFS